MDDLIARLEKATGPDRELDQAVAVLHRREITGREVIGVANCAEYTRSIDVALTLVPDGWLARGLRQPDPTTLNNDFARAWVYPHQTNDDGWAVSSGEVGRAANIALALCIACLKARASAASAPQPQTTPVGVAGETAMNPESDDSLKESLRDREIGRRENFGGWGE